MVRSQQAAEEYNHYHRKCSLRLKCSAAESLQRPFQNVFATVARQTAVKDWRREQRLGSPVLNVRVFGTPFLSA